MSMMLYVALEFEFYSESWTVINYTDMDDRYSGSLMYFDFKTYFPNSGFYNTRLRYDH